MEGEEIYSHNTWKNMMSTKCSSHFVEAYGEYKRSIWRSQEEERLRQMRLNGRFVMPDYASNGHPRLSRPRHTIYDEILLNPKSMRDDDSGGDEDESEDTEDECVWKAELQKERQSINATALSASHLETLQLLAARRSTLPENAFSKLRDQCSKVQSDRQYLPPVADDGEEDDEEEQDDERGNGECSFRATGSDDETNLPEKTKQLLRRSRQLQAVVQNRPRTVARKVSRFEEILNTPFNEGVSIRSRKLRSEHNRLLERRRENRNVNGKTRQLNVVNNNDRMKIIDINDSPPMSSRMEIRRQPAYHANTISFEKKRQAFVSPQLDVDDVAYMTINTNVNPSHDILLREFPPRRYPKPFTDGILRKNTSVYDKSYGKAEKTSCRFDSANIEELKHCRYLRHPIHPSTQTRYIPAHKPITRQTALGDGHLHVQGAEG